ncbi:12886_t:CDS:2 [Ambispora leptoticha]|uniref:12886_t:CDS:1 n=1 Tax=Ambispora leptoticha TaxID=144679 RepID=A0A9N9B4N9_9GLOM|nr:12886_t:CDS:2 [Ambispora leptoticha]
MRSIRVPFTEEGTILDQYSLELDGYMTRQLFSIRIRQFNETINAAQKLLTEIAIATVISVVVTIIYIVLNRRYNRKMQEAINHRLDEFNRIDNPKQLNWRVITDSYKLSGNQMVLIIEIGGKPDSSIVIIKSLEEAHINDYYNKQDTKEDYFNNVDNAPPAYN